jgi:hypothetical protein
MATMAKNGRKVKTVKPVEGKCKWLVEPDLPAGSGVLEIRAQTQRGEVVSHYVVAGHLNDAGSVTSWRLTKLNPGPKDDKTHDLEVGLDGTPCSCDCKDQVVRREGLDPATHGCKHIRSLTAALRKLGWID